MRRRALAGPRRRSRICRDTGYTGAGRVVQPPHVAGLRHVGGGRFPGAAGKRRACHHLATGAEVERELTSRQPRRVARFTDSQFLAVSVRSTVALSWPAPQSIVSRAPSRAEIVSLPPPAATRSLPAPGVIVSLPVPPGIRAS